jgi:hypothetical protein
MNTSASLLLSTMCSFIIVMMMGNTIDISGHAGFRCQILESGNVYLYDEKDCLIHPVPLTGLPGNIAKVAVRHILAYVAKLVQK